MSDSKTSENAILEEILDDLQKRFSDNIISIFGIGSYFDDSLPKDWIKNDLDIIVIVKSLETIPKPDWTDVRYEKKKIDDHEVWLGFNTLDAYQDKQAFETQSFSNYEWSLLDLKLPENSKLLFGQDIRDQLPDISELIFDYDDILVRSLYHLDKSFKEAIVSKNMDASMQQFSKGVFKFGFYLCIYFDKSFRFTSIRASANKIEQLSKQGIVNEKALEFVKDSIFFRRTRYFTKGYVQLRNTFILHVFSLIGKGKLHRKMKFEELVTFLEDTFGGLLHLIEFVQNIKKKYYQLKSE